MNDLSICSDTGEDVDDCYCLDALDYDERDEADQRFDCEREGE